MIGLLLVLAAVQAANAPPVTPSCRYYDLLYAQVGAIHRDTVDEFLCHVVVVDAKGDTLVRVDEYTDILPDTYSETHKLDATARKIQRLDSLLQAAQKRQDKK